MNLYREKIEQFSGKQNYVSVSKMAKPGVWGTDIEIMTVASILDTNVHTYIHKAWMQPVLAQVVKVGPRYPFTHQKQVRARDHLYHSGTHFELTVSILASVSIRKNLY